MPQPATRIPPQPSHTVTPTHNETRTHDQYGVTIEKSQAPDHGRINFRNILSIEEVKYNLITSDIKLVTYPSTITMMQGPIYIRLSQMFVYKPRKYQQLWTYNRRGSLLNGGVFEAIWTILVNMCNLEV